MSPRLSTTPTGTGLSWHQRLHAALMPDYNRAAAAYWWIGVLLGGVLLVACLREVLAGPLPVALQVAAAAVLAVLAGLFPVRIPGTKVSFVAGEIFLFLMLLLHGPAAGAVVAAAEAATGSLRTSRRWTSRIGSPAFAALSFFAAGQLFELGRQWLQGRGWAEAPAPLLALAMASAVVYFLFSAALQNGAVRLKRGEAFFQIVDAVSAFRWVGMAYAGSAAVATLLFVTYRLAGAPVLLVMLPLLLLLLVALHFYFREQEAGIAAREAAEAAAVREQAALAREAEAAARHLGELEASERRFHSAFTHASIGMALLGFDGRIEQTNPALRVLLQRDDDALLGLPFADVVAGDDRAAFLGRLGLAGAAEFEPFATELRVQRADGTEAWVALHCSFFSEPPLPAPTATQPAPLEGPVPRRAGGPCLILQVQDISARRRAEAGLEHMAYHDSLTGLPNRRRFVEVLERSIARAKADPSHGFAVMFLDFDRFKLVNDSLGHNAGDELLVQLARRIQDKLRPSDIVARLGGDEFALLAERIEQQRDAIVLAERLLGALAAPFTVFGTEVNASASIGITFSSFGYRGAEEVLRDADTAMYKAKSGGKARFAVFDSSLHTEVSRRLRLEGELRRAIEAGHLALLYQPVFELAGPGAVAGRPARLTGFEALIRWNHPRDGVLQPMAFLPIAEESGQMRPVSDFVLHCACRQLRQWQLSHADWAELTMSVNVAAEDMAQPGFVGRVTQALIESGLRPRHLTLELTENILMSRIEGAVQTLAELRRLGVHVAVDDFGTGHSSLSHLSKLPIDSLKIDKSFVGHLTRGSDEAAVVRAIIQLGQSLRKSIVAEGIENDTQMDQLREMGCALGQGHHLSVPLSADDAGELLRRHAADARLH